MIPLTLNWFGMAVHDVPASADFYGKRLGFAFKEDAENDLWRYFETRNMVFELFAAHPARINVEGWGHGQAFRPAILASDLPAVENKLSETGVRFSADPCEFGKRLEMVGPDQIRMSFIESPEVEMDWKHPLVGGIELKAARLEAQRDFYMGVFGMSIKQHKNGVLHLTQTNGSTWLRIEAGGRPSSLPTEAGNDDPAFFYPIWISFEIQDVESAKNWLASQDVPVLQPLTHHQDWGGTDIIIADPDGNAIQVVAYGKQ
jgi:catechol 2,3-dioxygenase-like lactoylglutathione lyase family enzyme